MPIPIKENKRYIAGIDGLRAIAVLSVIAYHLNVSWAPGGLLGVVIFFVLSGYLITDLIVMEWEENGSINLKKFWHRRIRRLFPALIVMVIVVMAWITLFNCAIIPNIRGDLLASLFYISNWWFIFHKISYFSSFGTPSPFTHLWSLAVEEQFYILWPLLLILGLKVFRRRTSILWVTLIIAIISISLMGLNYKVGTDPSRIYYGTDTRLFSLLFGAFLALIWPSRKLSKRAPRFAIITLDVAGSLSFVILIVMIWKTNQFEAFLYRGGMVLTSLAALILVATLAHPGSHLSKLLGFKPLRWIGVRSYSMYLWHYPIIVLSNPVANNEELNILRMTLQVFGIFLLSALSWRYIENPIRRGAIGKFLNNREPTKPLFKQVSLLQKLLLVLSLLTIGISFWGMSSSASESKNHRTNDIQLITTERKKWQDKDNEQKNNSSPSKEANNGQVEEKKSGPVSGVDETSITAIGDSVMLMVAPYLKKEFPEIVIDAKVGRQMRDASTVIQRLKSEGKLGDKVIIELGTNGPIDKNQLVSLIDSLGNRKKIILVNSRVPRPWESKVNSILREVTASSSRISLVNWYDASMGKDSYFYSDGVHPNIKGSQIYASLIAKAAIKK
ncbi:acyltransferase family protein [Neobacillus sp. PS2-9]|uniref:acyltransferase family protein n=1 Tax=Neobacillus sp. PS2-9 TaxID=3070676 RepID=UPI0027E016BF|nr:acyltransferase family protein [Neobacillus sp. PS2-9]WML58749.1 acyltransferase family protein [Neobacillus sp. PS2-9]